MAAKGNQALQFGGARVEQAQGRYLVRCVPQRGFYARRRAGIMITADGVYMDEVPQEILDDPGMIVTDLGEGRPAAPKAAGAAGTGVCDPSANAAGRPDDRARCAGHWANGKPCGNFALEGEEFCKRHAVENPPATPQEAGGEGAGASLTRLE